MDTINSMPDVFKDWIDNASYYELLKRWRFSTDKDDIFKGLSGDYYKQVMLNKKALLSNSECAKISKLIGW